MSALRQAAKLRQSIREFFSSVNFLEVSTPVLTTCPGVEVHLRFFATKWFDVHGQNPKSVFLRTSPEINLKKILASGEPRIFEFAPCFRNYGELSDWHEPEFTMLEWYEQGQTLDGLMSQTANLLEHCYQSCAPTKRIHIKRYYLPEYFQQITKVSLNEDNPEFAALLKAAGCISVQTTDDFETAFFKAMFDCVEPALKKEGAVMLYGYPQSTAALAKVEQGFAQRFECYIDGVELCNGFQELLGYEENKARFHETSQRRLALYNDPLQEDPVFLASMQQLEQPCTGNALGFDRLFALIYGSLLGIGPQVQPLSPFRR